MKRAYQIQSNWTKHLIEYEADGIHYHHVHFIPNLDIPTIESKKLHKQTVLKERQTSQPTFPGMVCR